MDRIVDWSLYLVTDRGLCRNHDLITSIQQAIDGGITALQLRDKDSSTSEFIRLGEKLLRLTTAANIPLIINDRADVALAIGADGVHLGQDDLSYQLARKILGPNALIGLTLSTPEEAKITADWDVAYLGVGPVFPTTTKKKVKLPLSPEGLKMVVESTSHKVVAIGGIKADSIQSILEVGATGVAVVSAILDTNDPKQAAKRLMDAIKNFRKN